VIPGCSGRILPHTVALSWPNMTTSLCAAHCKALGFTLSGVEASYGCFCGNALANVNPKKPDGECCAPCTGDSSEFCGDKFRIWIYNTSKSDHPRVCHPTPAPPPTPPMPAQPSDPRSIFNGTVMNKAGYLDQVSRCAWSESAFTQH
jgi:hypothetical protein